MPLDAPPIVRAEVVFIEDLLEEIAQGTLRVPRFQRPFIWEPSDMLNLFDSIYRGYPIGSFVLWQATNREESLDKVGPIEIPRPDVTSLTYILDGHQRLATLFGVLRLPEDYPKGPAQESWRWWIWFDLRERIFTHVPKGAPRPELIPLRAVLRTVDFLNEARRIQQECSKEDATEFIMEAEQLALKIKIYKVANTRITGGKLEESVEIFSRLNTLGRSLSSD